MKDYKIHYGDKAAMPQFYATGNGHAITTAVKR